MIIQFITAVVGSLFLPEIIPAQSKPKPSSYISERLKHSLKNLKNMDIRADVIGIIKESQNAVMVDMIPMIADTAKVDRIREAINDQVDFCLGIVLGTIVSICLWKFAERNLNPSPAELGLINTYFVDSIENFRNAIINRLGL